MENIREMIILKGKSVSRDCKSGFAFVCVTGYRKCESKTDQSSQISTTEKSGEVRMQ